MNCCTQLGYTNVHVDFLQVGILGDPEHDGRMFPLKIGRERHVEHFLVVGRRKESLITDGRKKPR